MNWVLFIVVLHSFSVHSSQVSFNSEHYCNVAKEKLLKDHRERIRKQLRSVSNTKGILYYLTANCVQTF